MADPKKTASKSTTKKTTSNKSNTGIKPVTGKIVPVSGKIQPVSYRPSTTTKKSTTTSKSSTSSKPKSASKPNSSKSGDYDVVISSKGVQYKNHPTMGNKFVPAKDSIKSLAPKKSTGVSSAVKKAATSAASNVKKTSNQAPVKKTTTTKPVAKTTTTKTTTTKASTPKYVEPGTKAYWAMTPEQRNANTMINIKESISGGPKKSTTTKKSTTPSKPTPRIAQAPVTKAPVKKPIVSGKNVTSKEGAAKIKGIVEGLERAPQKKKTETKPKPVAPKMPTIIGSAKASVPSKGKVKIEPNMGKPKSFTPPKTETKPKVQTAPKPAPRPEPIKMEMIPLATVAKQLQDSQREKLPSTIEVPKSVATTAKTPVPAEEKKGLFARMKERREERKAEKEAEKKGSAGNALAMRKGGMVKKYKKGGSIKKSKKK